MYDSYVSETTSCIFINHLPEKKHVEVYSNITELRHVR